MTSDSIMRIITCFDTETTGLNPLKERVVQLSWVTYDIYTNNIQTKHNYIIRIDDDDVIMSPESENIHGISMKKSKNEGKPIKPILRMLGDDIRKSKQIVGHNIQFDIGMLEQEYKRNDIESPFTTIKNDKIYCTMQQSRSLCKLPFRSNHDNSPYLLQRPPYYKQPKLSELHNYLFKEVYRVNEDGLHNALNDVLLTIHCYVILKHNIDLVTISPDHFTQILITK